MDRGSMKICYSVTVCVLLTCGLSLRAQSRDSSDAVDGIDLPAGNDAWLVQIRTSGGLAGAGRGNFAVSSEGRKACSPPSRCIKDFVPSVFKPLVDAIRPGYVTIVRPPVSLCNDCFVTTVVIRRRDGNGVHHVFTATWDDVTRSVIPPEVIQIYEAVLRLGN
jgi:hypothetical protein